MTMSVEEKDAWLGEGVGIEVGCLAVQGSLVRLSFLIVIQR
jgi:hypothetical protein